MSDNLSIKVEKDTQLIDHLVLDQKEDIARKKRFKVALATAIWLTLAAIWLPGFGFGQKVVTLSPEIDKTAPRGVTIKPKPKKTIITKPITKKRPKKIPLPDLTPLEPEPVIEVAKIEEPIVIDDFSDITIEEPTELPPAPPETVYTPGMTGVEPPVFTLKVPPKYPRRALSVGIQGYVLLEAILGEDGEIRDIKVLRGLGKGRFGFEEEARNALSQWEFVPGKVKGKTADIRMNLRITFRLNR